MPHSKFGWSYPPGCSGPPDDQEGPCEVCGRDSAESCICPECPTCGSQGDPACYETHGLIRSQEQIDGRKKMDEILETERKNEAEYWKRYKESDIETRQ